MSSICFWDSVGWSYRADAPFLGPFGGSQSAMCYLAIELAKLGHAVTLLTGTERDEVVMGVRSLPATMATPAFFAAEAFDAVVILNGPASRSELRRTLPGSTALLVWTGHNVDQAAMKGLARAEVRQLWDAIVCVSAWHRRMVIEAFDADADKVVVLRNAIAPAFETLFADREAFVAAKSDGLRLAYTSTPFRGLDLMPDIFPSFRAKHPAATFDVYSSMAVYRQSAGDDPHRALYDRLAGLAGVRYVGSLPQPLLASELARAHILAYPNTFAETSCIAVMEAMAAGLRVVTSDFGALRETTAGHADLVKLGPSMSRDKYIAQFKRALSDGATKAKNISLMYKQVQSVTQDCTWRVRARQWGETLAALRAGRNIAT